MTELSTKEKRLLQLICSEYSNSEIATKMQVGLRYTEKLKSALYKKTKTHSGIGLLKWALSNGHYALKPKPRKRK